MGAGNIENQPSAGKPPQGCDVRIVMITCDVRDFDKSESPATTDKNERSQIVATTTCQSDDLAVRTPQHMIAREFGNILQTRNLAGRDHDHAA